MIHDKVIVICGPTASGKTALSVDLAVGLGAEIINADSMQVYKGFNIGTAKPTEEEKKGIPHHLIDIVEPEEPFDAACFIEAADIAVTQIKSRKKLPLLVGGTGLYIRAFLHGLHKGPSPNPAVRKTLLERAEKEGREVLHQLLVEVDPATAQRLHVNDIVRVVRALEITISSGIPMSEWQCLHRFEQDRYHFLMLGIQRDRGELNSIIERRTDKMMSEGFLKEVEGLLKQGVSPNCKPMQALGYKQLIEFLLNKINLDDAVEQIKTETRRFAKRQMTWFRKEPGLIWVEPNIQTIEKLCTNFLAS